MKIPLYIYGSGLLDSPYLFYATMFSLIGVLALYGWTIYKKKEHRVLLILVFLTMLFVMSLLFSFIFYVNMRNNYYLLT